MNTEIIEQDKIATDREKLLAFADMLDKLHVPEIKDETLKRVASYTFDKLKDIVVFIKQQTESF